MAKSLILFFFAWKSGSTCLWTLLGVCLFPNHFSSTHSWGYIQQNGTFRRYKEMTAKQLMAQLEKTNKGLSKFEHVNKKAIDQSHTQVIFSWSASWLKVVLMLFWSQVHHFHGSIARAWSPAVLFCVSLGRSFVNIKQLMVSKFGQKWGTLWNI